MYEIDDMTVIVDPIMTEKEAKDKAGEFFGKECFKVFDKDVDIFTPEGVLIVSLRKNVIPKSISDQAVKSCLDYISKRKTTSRGYASGKVSIEHFSKNVVELLDPNNVKTRMKFADGRISTYKACNKFQSTILGYTDSRELSIYKKNKSIVPSKGRPTAFTSRYSKEWNDFIPVVEYMDTLFSKINEEQYNVQKEKIKDCNYLIGNTIFTTITGNYCSRCANHVDKGNVKDFYSGFFICENGESNWQGCYLGFVQYGVAVNVREGDFVLMNPFMYHANTEYEFPNGSEKYTRLSFVLYSRQGLL